MTFRILARSNIKDSMTFLITEPPFRRADRQRCQGDPAHTNAPARNLHRQRGHQADPGSSWLPTSRHIGGWNSPGDSLPADGGKQNGRQRPSRWSSPVSRRDPGTRSRGTTSLPRPDDGVHRHSAPRHQACQRWQPVNAPAAAQERGDEHDSKAVFLRPQPGSSAFAGRGLRV